MLPQTAQSPPVWHVASVERLRSEPLDSLTVLYDRASGQTHLLAPPLPQILAALMVAPASSSDLLAFLSATFDLSAEGDPVAVIEARLHELAALGLVDAR